MGDGFITVSYSEQWDALTFEQQDTLEVLVLWTKCVDRNDFAPSIPLSPRFSISSTIVIPLNEGS